MHGSTTRIPLRTGSSQPVKPLRLPAQLCKTKHAKREATGTAKMWKSRQNLCKTMTLSKSTASGIMDVQTKRKETNHAYTLRQDYPEPIKRIGGSMSGGHFDYQDSNLKNEIFDYANKPNNVFEDMEISHLVWDVLTLIHDYDWYVSGDTSHENYHTAKKRFKEKWFKSDRSDRLMKIIDSRLDDVREELRGML